MNEMRAQANSGPALRREWFVGVGVSVAAAISFGLVLLALARQPDAGAAARSGCPGGEPLAGLAAPLAQASASWRLVRGSAREFPVAVWRSALGAPMRPGEVDHAVLCRSGPATVGGAVARPPGVLPWPLVRAVVLVLVGWLACLAFLARPSPAWWLARAGLVRAQRVRPQR